MNRFSRRAFVSTFGASSLMAACTGGAGSDSALRIDARVDATRDYLFEKYPGTYELASRAFGILYIPLVTQIGFIYGGSYGKGALRIKGVTVDYYSAATASIGLQIGAQQYAHVLFFMTEEALADFRGARGWSMGADARYATPSSGGSAGINTLENEPVIAFVFGQQGLILEASLAGTKYTRIVP